MSPVNGRFPAKGCLHRRMPFDIGIVLVTTLVLVAGNSERIHTKGKLGGAASRETVFLLNNLFLTAVMLVVAWLVVSVVLLAVEEHDRNAKRQAALGDVHADGGQGRV